MHGSQIFHCSIGRSAQGRDIPAHANFEFSHAAIPPNSTLIIGGTHGDEPATVLLLEGFVHSAPWSSLVDCPTIVVSLANPDGYLNATRYNARGVDLNRNCGFNWRADSAEPPGPAPEGMVWIPGGEFSMGSDDPTTSLCGGRDAMPDARPIHSATAGRISCPAPSCQRAGSTRPGIPRSRRDSSDHNPARNHGPRRSSCGWST